LRNQTFFNMAALNGALHEKLTELNNRKFQKLERSRRELFDELDKPALQPLPLERYEYAHWKKATVNIDYHVEVERHYYSVPYQLVRKQLDVRITARTVEVLFKNRRVASHARSYKKGGYTTLNEHMPERHKKYLEWTPARIVRWAGETGPHTARLVAEILASKVHPQQGYRSCLGIMRLSKRYGPDRLEAACNRALVIRSRSYKSVESILKHGLDREELPGKSTPVLIPGDHENVRGRKYYHDDHKEDSYAH
jgi:transposase